LVELTIYTVFYCFAASGGQYHSVGCNSK